MAESLGSAVLTVSVDDAQLKAGLQAAERQATATGRAVEKAFTPSGKSVQTAANGLQYFIDTQGRIVQIFENATPLSLRPLGVSTPVRAVLELRGGESARRGIRRGARVTHPVFTPR